MVERTIKLAKKVRINALLTAGTLAITPAFLMQGVPGGTSYWNSCQIERIEVYGGDTASADPSGLTLTVEPVSAYSQPPFSVSDSGTIGAERARCGVRLGLLDRARWFGTADTTTIATVSSAGVVNEPVVVYASIQLVSPA
jgi:hypothetical protein